MIFYFYFIRKVQIVHFSFIRKVFFIFYFIRKSVRMLHVSMHA